jgi:Mrp family chromosome partitioning ATPase
MSRYVDSVILVVAQGRTRRKSLARVRELCAQVDAPVIGTILNGVATKGADSEAYGYGRSYRYGYGQSRTYGSDASSSGKGSSKRKSVSARPASPALSAVDLESEQTGS